MKARLAAMEAEAAKLRDGVSGVVCWGVSSSPRLQRHHKRSNSHTQHTPTHT